MRPYAFDERIAKEAKKNGPLSGLYFYVHHMENVQRNIYETIPNKIWYFEKMRKEEINCEPHCTHSMHTATEFNLCVAQTRTQKWNY